MKETFADPIIVVADGRAITISKPDKVLWPRLGFTKKDLVDYMVAVAPVLLPHLRDRAVTMVRSPDGIDGRWWYQTECHQPPEWIATVRVPAARGDKVWNYCTIDTAAALAWSVNIGCIEIHPLFGRRGDIERTTTMVFDLDPGPGTDVIDCCRVALEVRRVLETRGMSPLVKTSGRGGIHVHVPLDHDITFGEAAAVAHELARDVARARPDRVTDQKPRAARRGKVFIDWQQNGPYKSLVAPYSPRLLELPFVAVPLSWGDIAAATETGDPQRLLLLPHEVLERLASGADPWKRSGPRC